MKNNQSLETLLKNITSYPKPEDKDELYSLLYLIKPEFNKIIEKYMEAKDVSEGQVTSVIKQTRDALSSPSSPYLDTSSNMIDKEAMIMFTDYLSQHPSCTKDLLRMQLEIFNNLDALLEDEITDDNSIDNNTGNVQNIDISGIKIKRIASTIQKREKSFFQGKLK